MGKIGKKYLEKLGKWIIPRLSILIGQIRISIQTPEFKMGGAFRKMSPIFPDVRHKV